MAKGMQCGPGAHRLAYIAGPLGDGRAAGVKGLKEAPALDGGSWGGGRMGGSQGGEGGLGPVVSNGANPGDSARDEGGWRVGGKPGR